MFYEDTGQFTPKQIKLAKEIASKIKALRKSGCAIVARQDSLYAYISEEWNNSTCDTTPYPLKHLDCGDITDAGADDTDYLEEWYIEKQLTTTAMKKMCFSERFGLHDAVLEGRKTHTRRMIPLSALAKIEAFQREYYEATLDRLDGIELPEQYYNVEKRGKLPFKVGDIVAVAQRYCSILDELEDPKNFCCMGHWELANGKRAHYAGFLYHPGFMNKMFVDAEEMPHQIRIKRVWFEHLQDISNEDCLKEGIDKWTAQGKRYYGFFDNEKDVFSHHPTPRDAYAHLIDRISGKGTWASNPLVIAYEFEKVK